MEQRATRKAETWKKKALVCEDFQKAAAWTQTTLFFPLDYLHDLKTKKLKKGEKNGRQLEQVEFCVVSSRCFPYPRRWSTRDRKTIIMFYHVGKEYPSEDTGG